MRIVSMLPSATEIIYALGIDDELVGVTFECDEPAVARSEKAVVVAGHDTTGMTPGAIDTLVRTEIAGGRDLYTLDVDALAALSPDLILTQDLCRVCALPAGHVDEALAYLGCSAEVLSLDPHTLDEVLETIDRIGTATGTTERATALVAGLRSRLALVARRVEGRGRPRVAVIEWTDPPFVAGHWVPELVSAAGGQPVAARPGGRSVESSWSEITAAAPEHVIVAPCGYHLGDAVDQARSLTALFPGQPIWAIDSGGLVVRPGPRLVDGVEAIAAAIHPDPALPLPAGAIVRVN